MCSRIKGAGGIGRNLKCVYLIHLFVNWKQDITGDDSILMFVLAFSSKCAWVSGCLEVIFDRTALSTCFCAPSIRCVCSCGRQVHRSGSAFTVGLSGRPGSPPAGCKSTNVASWRILLLLYLRSVPPPHALLYGDVRQKLGEKALGPRERIHLLNKPNPRVNR